MTASDYKVEVRYSTPDRGFLATVREFPQLYYVARSRSGAYEGLQMKLQSVLGARRFDGISIPLPLAEVWKPPVAMLHAR